jgi:hemoglobin
MTAVPPEEMLRPLIERFYGFIRRDPALAPVFRSVIAGWSEHQTHLTDFWSSVTLRSGRYKGYPVALHMHHAAHLTPELFRKWLCLWRQATFEMTSGAALAGLKENAGRLPSNLQLTILHRPSTSKAMPQEIVS